MNDNAPLLDITNLKLSINTLEGSIQPIRGISFSIKPKEMFALVGESGSGKSLTALSILRLLPLNANILPGSEIRLGEQYLLPLTEIEMRRVRAHKIGFIFQDPMSALNPVMTIGKQMLECLSGDKKQAQKKIYELLEYVRIADIKACLKAYPHQLSGGMKQRIMIAMALTKSPDLLIADEPTTALDVTTQAQVLNLIQNLKNELGMSVLLITHDLGIVSQFADHVAVMNQGEIVEKGSRESLFRAPQHPYTKKLLAALPENATREPSHPIAPTANPVLAVQQLKMHYGPVKAVDEVSFELGRGQTLCLVGESGCGKTTLGKSIMRLLEPNEGRIHFDLANIAHLSPRQMKPYRRDIQMIFQDPYAAMDPRMRVETILSEGLDALKLYPDKAKREAHIDELLTQVGLTPEMKYRFPHEFSGGQRQRIAIARALAVHPKLIVCDEPTSSLDVSIQAQILNLLKSLQKEYHLSYLFITHNIGVVRYLADYVAVMYLGRIVEYGSYEAVLNSPKHPYTQALLDAVPTVGRNIPVKTISGEIPSPRNPPSGCHFAPRCPHVFEACKSYPPSFTLSESHEVRCFLYQEEMEHSKAI